MNSNIRKPENKTSADSGIGMPLPASAPVGNASSIDSVVQPTISEGSAAIDPLRSDSKADGDLEITLRDIGQIIDSRKEEIIRLISVNDKILNFLTFGIAENLGQRDPEDSFVPNDVKLISIQRSVNSILSGYFLPAIAALLGVTVFLMRSGSKGIENISFKAHNATTYWYRIILGFVGGISISWFTVGESSGILASITPAALAFLIGYSVEILYNILNSIVKSLGGSQDEAVG